LIPLFGPGVPQLQQREEVGLLVAQRRVLLVGLRLFVGRTVARIGHGQRGGDDRDFLEAMLLGAGEQDPTELRVQR
jgi:hypothetical protein